MGLDQYFEARKSVYKTKWDKEHTVLSYPAELKKFEDYIYVRNFMCAETYYDIGYFRKVNSVHSWIINNCANGEDHCQRVFMSDEKIHELRDALNTVLADRTKAAELLPTQSGFFFGGTEYDEWYFEDLKEAKVFFDMLCDFIDSEEGKDYDICYHASW